MIKLKHFKLQQAFTISNYKVVQECSQVDFEDEQKKFELLNFLVHIIHNTKS